MQSRLLWISILLLCVPRLCAASNVNSGIAQVGTNRSVPRCLSPENVTDYMWVRPNEDHSKFLRQAKWSINIEMNPWTSANVTAYIAAMLLHDVMDVQANVWEISGSPQTYDRIDSGMIHANMEVWGSNKQQLYEEYVYKRGTASDFGLVGYNGKVSLFINQAAADAHPSIVWNSWMSLRRPEALALLPAFGTTPTATLPNGQFLCDSQTYAYCTNGVFVPPQCSQNPSSCRELWHVDPSYTQGTVEQLVTTLELPLVVIYLGDAFVAKASSCAQQSSFACLVYYWVPELLIAEFSFLQVLFPPWNATCYDNFSVPRATTGQSSLGCDWPIELLHKLGSPRMAVEMPQAFTLLRFFSLNELEIVSMLQDVAKGIPTELVACNWIKGKRTIWSKWIQPPPSEYMRSIRSLDLTSPLSAIIIFACGLQLSLILTTTIALVRLRNRSEIRAQSPPFMFLIIAGQVLVVLSVARFSLSPESTLGCQSRIWLLCVGFTIVIASTLVKSWRLCKVLGNYKLRQVPKVKNLILAVGGLTAFAIALLALWTMAASPTYGHVPLSKTEVLGSCVCSAASSSFATLATSALFIYEGSLLLVACALAFRIRNVATVFNDSRLIAFSMYTILVIGLFVIPIVYLPLHPMAQVGIKCFGILFAAQVNFVSLVVRPVSSAFFAALKAAGSDRQDNVLINKAALQSEAFSRTDVGQGKSTRIVSTVSHAGTRHSGGNMGTSAGTHSVSITADACVRTSELSMKRAGAMFAVWEKVRLTLLMSGTAPTLLVATEHEQKGGHGRFFTGNGNVTACPIPVAVQDSRTTSFDCFLLTLGSAAGTFIVQAESEVVAHRWVYTIQQAFSKAGQQSHSLSGGSLHKNRRTSGTSGHSAHHVSNHHG